MDVLLNEDEELLKNSARELLQAECSPQLVRSMETDAIGYSPELWKKLAELGWLGLALPEEYGGQALPLVQLGIFFGEIGRAIAPVPLHSTMVAALTIAADGSQAQRKRILPSVIDGEAILTWAFTEEDPRLVPEAIQAKAVLRGDELVLTGTKMFVENFEASARCLVVCRTAAPSAANEGISLLLVDTDAAGITATPLVTAARDRQSRVSFDEVRVPRARLIGELHQGWPIVSRMLDRAIALLCTQLAGTVRRQAEMAIEHAKFRVAFGKPIGSFQSIAHACADMIIWIDGAELLSYEALWRMDNDLPATIEVSQAKAFCNDRLMVASYLSNQIHGGIAFMRELDLTLWFRRAVAGTMKLGTSFEHRARVAAALFDKPGRVRLGESMYELAAP